MRSTAMTPRRVMIASPVHDFRVDVRFCHSMAKTMKLCTQRGIEALDFYPPGNAIISDARNEILAMAVEAKVNDLIFIDSDQDWQAEWIPQLLSYPVDCVGGAVRKKTDESEQYNVKASGGVASFYRHPKLPILSAPDLALGTGFLRLSERAVKALWESAEPYTHFGHERRWVFDARPMDTGKAVKELVGEDIMVSEKLRALGIYTWLDPKMTCGHYGVKGFNGNFANWLAKQLEPIVAESVA